jgi:acetyltransferase-like isoleucine patch superfamily enzyme
MTEAVPGPPPIDRASYRNRGGAWARLLTAYKLWRYFTRWGRGNMISAKADFRMTDGAILEIGDDCSILDYAFFQLTKPHPKVVIGDRTVIGRHTMITAKNSIRIGSDVLIGAYVQIIDHNHGFIAGAPIREQRAVIGNVEIGDDVWIGAGVKILSDVKIGDGAVIGSNAVVTDDVEPNAIVGGVPARLIRMR